MRLRYDKEAGVAVVHPDDPEELIHVDADDAEAMEETRPRMIVTPEEARKAEEQLAAGAIEGAQVGPGTFHWPTHHDFGPRLKRSH
jgi:hypothetical protein